MKSLILQKQFGKRIKYNHVCFEFSSTTILYIKNYFLIHVLVNLNVSSQNEYSSDHRSANMVREPQKRNVYGSAPVACDIVVHQ